MPEKKGGLRPEHHGELNKPGEVYPGGKQAKAKKVEELRQEYAGDPVARQQIDVYDESNNEYHRHLHEYIEAMQSGNTAKQQELEQWFKQNYPDLSN